MQKKENNLKEQDIFRPNTIKEPLKESKSFKIFLALAVLSAILSGAGTILFMIFNG